MSAHLLDVHLAGRHLAPIPERLAFVREFSAEVSLYDPSAGFKSTGYHQTQIYSIQARPEMVSLERNYNLVMDLRFVEICFDLVQAVRQREAVLTNEFLYFIIGRVLLEQLTLWSAGPYHVGAFFDYVVARASQPLKAGGSEGGLVELPMAERQRCVEFITKFTAAHEITRYALASDREFVRDWCGSLNARLEHYRHLFSSNGVEEVAPYIREGLEALLADIDAFHQTGRLSVALEECVCDFSASLSLVEALSQRSNLSGNVRHCGELLSALIAARWLVATVGLALRTAFERNVIDLTQALHLLLNRGSINLLLLFSLIGERLHGSSDAAQSLLVTAWQEQPDFEEVLTAVINTVFSAENFERFRLIGECALTTGAADQAEIKTAILRFFDWLPASS